MSILRRLAACILEQWTATYGAMIAAAAFVYLSYPFARFAAPGMDFRQFNRVLSLPCFPLQMIAALVVGHTVRRWFGGKFTFWVWAIPLAFLSVAFAAFRPGIFENPCDARLHHFLGSGCRTPACFDQLRYTAPFCASVAYSLGAWLEKTNILKFRNRPIRS
jgi:hypothetical protein